MKAIAVRKSRPGLRADARGDRETPAPGPGEVLIKVAAAGLNHADMAQAKGLYPPPPGAPPTLGMEVSGTVEALGDGVSNCEIGDEVCALIPRRRLCRIRGRVRAVRAAGAQRRQR